MPPNPRLRESIDISLHNEGSEKVIFLNCRLGLSQPLALISAVGPILIAFDGLRSYEEIVADFESQGVKSEIVERVFKILDDNYYLANENYYRRSEEVLIEFRNAPTRLAALAGSTYSGNTEELNAYIKSLLDNELPPTHNAKLFALVAPHIDYRRGAACYAKAYKLLSNQKPDICVVIGTSHQGGKSLFQLTTKDFAGPNGTLKVNQEFLGMLLAGYGKERGLCDELLHRREHSLELQMPFLSYLCPTTEIVPILVNGFYAYLLDKNLPKDDPEYNDFVKTISDTIKIFAGRGKHVAIICGVDMAHVGKNFGDSFELSPEKVEQISRDDQVYLNSIQNLSSKDMFDHIASDGDQRRICGFSTMHTVIDVLKEIGASLKVEVADYSQAVDQESQCLVSFAGMGIYVAGS